MNYTNHPDGVGEAARVVARVRLAIDPACFVVLCGGVMAPRGGVDTVVLALAMLQQRYGVDASLIVIDSGACSGSSQVCQDSRRNNALASERLRQLARDLDVAQRVRLTGRERSAVLNDCHAAANVFVSMPWHAAAGCATTRALGKAMARALPVVGAAVDGIGAMVLDGVTGYLVPARDPDALCQRLARLHRLPHVAQAMGAAGQERARAWTRTATDTATQRSASTGASPLTIAFSRQKASA